MYKKEKDHYQEYQEGFVFPYAFSVLDLRICISNEHVILTSLQSLIHTESLKISVTDDVELISCGCCYCFTFHPM